MTVVSFVVAMAATMQRAVLRRVKVRGLLSVIHITIVFTLILLNLNIIAVNFYL